MYSFLYFRFGRKGLDETGGALIYTGKEKKINGKTDYQFNTATEGGVKGSIAHLQLPPVCQDSLNPEYYIDTLGTETQLTDCESREAKTSGNSGGENANDATVVEDRKKDSADITNKKDPSCGSVVFKCPFSGVSLEGSDNERKISQNLSPIETVCEIEQQSLKKKINTDQNDSTSRKRKQGVIERPGIIEQRSEDKTRYKKHSGDLKSNESARSCSLRLPSCSFQLNKDKVSLEEKTSEGPLSSPKLRELRRNPSKEEHVSSPALEKRRIASTSPIPSAIPSKVTERTRAVDQGCAMYGMLLLSACQFGQVSLVYELKVCALMSSYIYFFVSYDLFLSLPVLLNPIKVKVGRIKLIAVTLASHRNLSLKVYSIVTFV